MRAYCYQAQQLYSTKKSTTSLRSHPLLHPVYGTMKLNPYTESGMILGGGRGFIANAMHITASVFINDDESGLHQDYEKWLEKFAPHEPVSQYLHNRTGEDNGDAHLKRQIMGREVVVAITDGKLDVGPWEQIFYGEFDGRRRKRVLVKIIGE